MGEKNAPLQADGNGGLQDQFEKLRQLAAKDALSGLLNRATMEQYIKARLQAMGREETCALFIVDLDDFKRVNDTLGHMAGDEAIRTSGRILSGLFRANDIVGRLGGDEFAVFLCGEITEELVRQKAAAICEQLHLALGDREIVNVTASVGVYLASSGQAFEGLYQTADLALYKAKKGGKHRFCLKSRTGYQESGDPALRPVNAISLGGLLREMDSGVAILAMGDDPQLIYVSPSFCRILDIDIRSFPLPGPLDALNRPADPLPPEPARRHGLREGAGVEHTHRISVDSGKTWRWWHIRAVQADRDSPDPLMLVTAIDISRFKETELRQEEQLRLLKAALEQTSKRLWEVDVGTGAFRVYSRDGTFQPLTGRTVRFPEDLIQGGWVHPSSVSRVRVFAQELLGGRARGFGNFAVRYKETGHYNWVSVSYRMLYDDVGRAVRAVGVLEELPQDSGRGGWAPDQYPLPERLVADLISRMRADLDLDTVEVLWLEGADLSGQARDLRCSHLLQQERQRVFSPGERQDLLQLFDRKKLRKLFLTGQHWLCAEYRRVDNSGSIRWVRQVLFLAEDPATRHLHLFTFLIRLDAAHQLGHAIRAGSPRDPVTRLFRREAVRQIAEELFSRRKGGNRAVAVLQADGLPAEAPDAPGPDADRLRYDLAAGLSLALGGSCVLGRYGADQFVVVFPSMASREELHRCLAEALVLLRRVVGTQAASAGLRFLVGVHLMPASTAVYSAMLAQAARMCASLRDAAADTIAFVPEERDWTGELPFQSGQKGQFAVAPAEEAALPMSEQEKDVALRCMSTMLNARTLDASLLGVLRTIGEFYRADRVYTLMLVEDRRAVVMTFEWTSVSKRSIQQVVSGMSLERFPLLKRCMAEGTPVFLNRKEPIDLTGDAREDRPWSFAAIPLIRGDRADGFLCIENAREHSRDTALFSALIPLILQQRERFSARERPGDTTERLMGLPDLRAYTQTVYSLTPEHYSSLGVVCLDIPDLASVNSSLGFEYGSRMLWYVAKTLTEIFGGALLFRTWESEFVIFYPNTTRDVFLGRCGRLRSILQRRYPQQIRIGRAWSDGSFSGKRLADEARAAIRSGSGERGGERVPLQSDDYSSVAEATRAGRFIVYYQPKLDMRDGSLAGAEALVRAVANDGSIVPPGQFIDFLEADGSIRDLDLYVLEQALSQADQWRAAGLGTVPIAVNLSRVTLVHPSTLASVLAVQSRYPLIPAPALELEVTERGDGIRTAELREIVERFRACGLRMALDDFGSQYANLSLFTSVRFETVKLDRSLIAELEGNPMNRALVRDLVQICKSGGMTCVAEGVETQSQADALLDMGCTYAQGFLYDRPLPAAAFAQKYLMRVSPSESEQESIHERSVTHEET